MEFTLDLDSLIALITLGTRLLLLFLFPNPETLTQICASQTPEDLSLQEPATLQSPETC
jgi:hypothetical protein